MKPQMLDRLRFAHRIYLMPALAAAALVVVFVVVQLSGARTAALVEEIDSGYIPRLELSRDLVDILARIQRGLQDAAAAADDQILEETDALRRAFMDRLDSERDNPTVDREELAVLAGAFDDYYSLARQTTGRLIARESGEAVSAALERMGAGYLELKARLEGFAEGARADTDLAVAAVQSSQRQARTLIFVVILASVAILGALSFTVIRSIVRPLDDVVRIANQVAAGDLSQRIAIRSGDEIGQTSRALNQALGGMCEAIKTIAGNSTSLKGASEEMSSVSQQMAASAEETSTQATVVSAAAEQVSRNVETVATGVEEMSSSIREISRSAQAAARVATEAVEVAGAASGTIAKLGQSSSRINEITKVITSISEQTNLLALNATIEAARAGESGRGFAVVANEVKTLARETAAATDEIAKRIDAIQGDTQDAVAAIATITSIITQIHEIQNNIASAVEEQTATTNEIARSVAEVASGSSDIAGNISGVATATRDTATGASATQRAANELAAMALRLEELVGRFRYEDE